MATLKLDVAMRTDRGVVRENNEDAVGVDASAGLMILSDGMGGANAGEIASSLTVDLLLNQLVVSRSSDAKPLDWDDLLQALEGVNYAIFELAGNVPEYHGMGATLVLGLFQQDGLTYAHVGDSRLYRFRHGALEPLTRDHTLIEELIELGEFQSMEDAIAAGVSHNVLSRAFGAEPKVEVAVAETDLSAGDLFLFCSDGLTNMVSERELKDILQSEQFDLKRQVDALIERACANGGMDNIAVILARVINSDG
ncbi:MAG: protein phosphatase 2C domain-containing protein [Pseudomonadota bacterium]